MDRNINEDLLVTTAEDAMERIKSALATMDLDMLAHTLSYCTDCGPVLVTEATNLTEYSITSDLYHNGQAHHGHFVIVTEDDGRKMHWTNDGWKPTIKGQPIRYTPLQRYLTPLPNYPNENGWAGRWEYRK